jgi:pyridoxal phosphate enzyme (YggS family)
MATISENLQAVRARIERSCGASQKVTLLAVSKGHGVARIREALTAGQRAFGENYVQEALEKMRELPALEWHLIGPLQSNKTRLAAERFDWIHTLHSEKIARRLSEQRPSTLEPLNVLIQVNISREETKSGVALEEARALAEAVARLPRLRLRGLMAMPEPTRDIGSQRARFRAAREKFDELAAEFGFDTLSMGMSDDMEAAIAEGATLVRIGTAIFGARKKEKTAA